MRKIGCLAAIPLFSALELQAASWGVFQTYFTEKFQQTVANPSLSSPNINFLIQANSPPGSGPTTIAVPGSTLPGSLASPGSLYSFTSLSGFESAFPVGNYTFSQANPAGGSPYATTVVLLGLGPFPQVSTPALTLSSFDALQGLDPTQALDLNWVTPGESFEILQGNSLIASIGYDATGDAYLLPANLLASGTTYNFQLTNSSNASGRCSSAGDTCQDSQTVTTTGTFTTAAAAAPEPISFALVGVSLLTFVPSLGYRKLRTFS